MDDYYGYDLRLSNWDAATHTGVAEVLGSPAGECTPFPFRLDIDIEAASERVQRTASAAVELGELLSRSILRGDALTLWYESYQLARERGRGLRLRLHIAAWELSRLPWELPLTTVGATSSWSLTPWSRWCAISAYRASSHGSANHARCASWWSRPVPRTNSSSTGSTRWPCCKRRWAS